MMILQHKHKVFGVFLKQGNNMHKTEDTVATNLRIFDI